MGILGIENRTENWKTAFNFAPFIEDANLRLKLAGRLGEPSGTPPSDISMELFWKGMRDFHHPNGRKGMDVADFVRRYDWLFGYPKGILICATQLRASNISMDCSLSACKITTTLPNRHRIAYYATTSSIPKLTLC